MLRAGTAIMLDVTRLLYRADEPDTQAAGRGVRFADASRPVVVWNLTRRCNLHCRHCYASARSRPRPEELTAEEGRALVDELGRCRVPALILSGGDPVLRPDMLDLARRAADLGIHPALSTNGTLIDAPLARSLGAAGVRYVGVSVDGLAPTHDLFRGMSGAYEQALDGLRHCRDAGLTVGLRFTLSRATRPDLERVLDLMEAERVQRGYISHLVYVGRADRLAPHALTRGETRAAVEAILARAASLHRRGVSLDLVTGNSDADGVFLYLRALAMRPDGAPAIWRLLLARGGNSAGRSIANVDDRGEVHPDQFWPHHALGNVRERRFGDIWADPNMPLLARLRYRRAHVHGRCARCPFFDICGGGSRVRAEALTGDLWASDPGCYLTDQELGLVPQEESDHASTVESHAHGADSLLPECAAPYGNG
jgi:radical SAM protein with 4Fe4S-binding SPASM domain